MTREELLQLIDKAADEGQTELDLAGLGLEELPPEIGKCTQLESLVLGKVESWIRVDGKMTPQPITNQLTSLPEELRSLANLRSLDLGGNPFGKMPELLLEMKQLENLSLTCIGLTEIPVKLNQLSNLKELDLGDNQIAEMSEVLNQMSHLTRLDLDGNQIAQIPQAICQLSNLTHLSLWNNQIAKISEAINQLSHLTHLNLRDNQIMEIPEALCQISHLTLLELNNNQVAEIPEDICQLSNLTHLYLFNNQIAKIPEVLCQLSHLKGLYLSDNQIAEIPEALCQLSNLRQLFLSDNQISEIPEALCQLSHMTDLYVNNNKITEIPEALCQIPNLTLLTLSNNQIAKIPTNIGQLSHLRHLSLHNNQIIEIPKEICLLSNLIKLILDNNQIIEIPEEIGLLSNLRYLYLGNNRIEKIPESLETLPNLEILDLRNNCLPISPEVLGPANPYAEPGTPAAIFNYLRQLRSGEVLPLNEAKVLLVGQGSVGKTSLINRLTHNQYNPNQPQTDGLNITNLQITVNTKPVKLNVWDFGGQEIYHATHQFFLTKRSLYLLVSNCRTSEDENRLEYWLKLIESFGDASPVILVGNKCDEQPLDLNRKALRDKYPNIKAIIETSCQSGTGIDELRSAIHTEISELKEVYDLLPLSWFQVKQRLENLDKDFITISEYATICATENILAETDQTQLIGLLHNLGIVLNFREHPILQSTNILNPHWVTEGIYALLSDDALKVKTKGILTYADLSRILDSTKYPSHRYNCLTELMGEFQLCFPLSHCTPRTFLIPGILPKEEPENTKLEGETLEFQYHYRILPDSILSRFIVLMHEKIHNCTHWRTGVMLEYTEGAEVYNIARIKSDPEDEKISIAVSGRESTRRSFLSMIRDTFTKIHNSFANLEISQWVPVPGYPDADPLDYEELLGLEEMGENTVRVGKLKLKLDLRSLLDGYESIELRRRRQRGDDKYGREYDDLVDIAKLAVSRPIINKAEAKMTQNTPQHNNFSGAQIGSVAVANEMKDNAQQTASGGIEINNANTAEILKLISSMRESATQFPEDIRDGIIIDIEDVEAEIKKPESQWNKARLKKSLTAMIGAATAIAIPIAGMTDFANSAIDLGEKVGIEIQLPSSR
ncbi:MAG: leucine-rich repeat domain-containing protein [Microcoleus sp. PH2017_02_FOX_O_A]|nr:leucine-rich repeat domain-containing protein [Microcoleus sp. PH2017_02_FOX_O_A]MCC3514076.1 leucine-rich repeat domain-containing protein [Microcoleus sp. PH2017_18_LLB_O_A]